MENVPMTVTDGIMMVDGKGLVASNFTQLWELSQIFAASGMVPKDYIGKPAAVFVAINMGAEIGLSPTTSVQNIAVINGRPSIYGDIALGLVRASGQLTGFTEMFEGKFPDNTFRAVCTVKRGNETIIREFTIEDARVAGKWVYPNSGVTPWHTAPKRMLQMRARGFALRDAFGDVLKGISMTEEIQDYDISLDKQEDGTYAATPETPKKKAKKKSEETTEAPSYTPVPPKLTFQRLVDLKGIDPQTADMLGQYLLSIVAQKPGSTRESVEATAVSYFERFWISFEKWLEGLCRKENLLGLEKQYPFCNPEIMKLSEEFPAEYKQACLEISDPTTAERCERVKKRVNELIDLAAERG